MRLMAADKGIRHLVANAWNRFMRQCLGPTNAAAPLRCYPESSRTVRVFISSTFSDMQDERDVMMREVFPSIRLFCEDRDVRFSEVDLRWGITSEEAAEGRVLEL